MIVNSVNGIKKRKKNVRGDFINVTLTYFWFWVNKFQIKMC